MPSQTYIRSTRSQGPVGRYAPSPTGRLHLGNLRTAVVAYDDIRERGGTLILRMEDTDTPRTVEGAAEAILDDLAWLGLTFDEGPHLPGTGGPYGPYVQSRRQDYYLEALSGLLAAGVVYPCTCSRRDLQSAASAPHGPEGPAYPGTCRRTVSSIEQSDLVETVRAVLKSPGPLPFSLRVCGQALPSAAFLDEAHGEYAGPAPDDFVLFRRDGLWAYQFVCAVDDALMGVTRVVRGADLLASTPRQVALIRALGYPVPVYKHIPLAQDTTTGSRMAKRDGSLGLDALKLEGLSPPEVRQRILDLPILP